jgi:uncharacterized membrane protein YobD (UPF0266 family)
MPLILLQNNIVGKFKRSQTANVNGQNQALAYIDKVNLSEENVKTIQNNAEMLVQARKESDLDTAIKIKCINMTRTQNKQYSHNM